ncbi:MAG: hypothetical protein Q8P76_01180 [bacterium]|nr:hypothetical protein [bacterium]
MKTLEAPRFEPKKEKAPEKKETEAKYNFEAIAELEKPMANLAEQLKEAIDKGEYDTLISDDAGGRIPTLVFRKVMMERMQKMHPDLTPEQEREAMKTFFVAGGMAELNRGALKKFFNKTAPKIKKALLVTEFMESGKSIRRLGDLLEGSKIDFSIAAAQIGHYRHNYQGGVYDRHRFYIGDERTRVPLIYPLRRNVGGVIKLGQSKEAHPKIYSETDVVTHGGVSEMVDFNRKIVIQARQDVDLMAKRILEKVWGNKDN